MVDITTLEDSEKSRDAAKTRFKTDLEYGKDAEYQILKRIQNKYPLAFMIEGKFKAFDLFVPELGEGVEVKSDRQAEQTGNVFIEIECNHVCSGIRTTKAGWYIYQTKNRIFWVKTDVIKNYLIGKAKELPMFCNTPKGEHSPVRGYLIPIDHFKILAFHISH